MRLLAILQDIVAAAVTRQRIKRHKLATYDALRLQNESLRLALRTQEQSIQTLMAELTERESEIERIRSDFHEARQQAEAKADALTQQQTIEIFRRLELTLTQLPTLLSMVEEGVELPAADVLRLINPLLEEFRLLGIKAIGRVGDELPYDPARHRVVGMAAQKLSLDDHVIVRYVGYEFEGQILSKVQVTPIESSEAIAGSL